MDISAPAFLLRRPELVFWENAQAQSLVRDSIYKVIKSASLYEDINYSLFSPFIITRNVTSKVRCGS